MLKLDDSIFEYALYDVLHALHAEAGKPVPLDSLRSQWRMTGLRHTDLYLSLELLTTAESLVALADDAWTLTDVGAERMLRVASVSTPTMADQVARSVLQLIKERVPAAARAPRPVMARRRAVMRVRVRDRG
ncbi:hypothetical protein [Nevskia sp.]|uniref:hypothetical protein n=1 Tax=Nevskia sp. TaxID=1929292 RepID=UPI0025FD0D76|nr:hypothetical protein [Nevskia sp.]HET7797803.1 hypothetical protein [Nevskia sp.]